MTLMRDRSIAGLIGVAGIVMAAAAHATLTQTLTDSERLLVSFAESEAPGGLGNGCGPYAAAEADRDDPEETAAQLKDTCTSPSSTGVALLGHYPGYAARHLPVDRIRYDALTCVSYFSILPLADGDLDTSEVDGADLEELVARAHANGIKTIITVGGWGRSTFFPTMAASPDARANFARKLLQYCLEYNLDGVDLDWEPVSTARDRGNYSVLVEALHTEFKPFGRSLSLSVSAYGHEILPQAIAFVDSLNVMAYDGTPPHHSTFDFAVSALKHWEDYGAAREKLMLGLPFYGRSDDGTGYAYREVFDAYHPPPDTDVIGGIGFNGVNTIKEKTAYAVNNGYRGIMIWELSQDTIDEGSLLTAAVEAIAHCRPGDLNGNGSVDLHDFRVLASAWRSDRGDDNWDPRCNIFRSGDSLVDARDLAAFCRDWLAGQVVLWPVGQGSTP